MRKQHFARKLRRIFRSVVNGSADHDPLLINSLAAFNFRPPMNFVFPGERKTQQTAFTY